MKQKRSISISLLFICLFGLIAPVLSGCASGVADNTVFSVDDLPGKTIGVQLATTGDIYASDYEGDDEGTVIERYNRGADAISSLKQGKIDCVIIDEEPAKAFVSRNPDLMILDEEFVTEDYAGVIAKENTELLGSVNAALEELMADGTLDKIKNNYIADEKTGETTAFVYEKTVTEGPALVIATNATFPPYEYYENGEMVGIDIDIAAAVSDKLGRTLRVENMEFDAIISAVASGKADAGFSGFTVTEDRKKQINFTDSYTTSRQVIVVRNGENASGIEGLKDRFYKNFAEDGRWKYLAQGLLNTLIITVAALLIGSLLGFLIAMVRVAYDKNGTCKALNLICRLYVTVIRGTPMMVQLLIIYFVIFASVDISKIVVAIIAFGLNSAAYLSEVIRSGIMSIDPGQFEAGKSLGLGFGTMMREIILPQALKNVLPAIGNEFISLLKETSISGYIGLQDLTRGGDIIRGITYEPFLPLLTVALVYLILVILLSAGVRKLEASLKKNER